MAPKTRLPSLLAEAWDERVMQICGCDHCWQNGEHAAPEALQNPCPWLCEEVEGEDEADSDHVNSEGFAAGSLPEQRPAGDAHCQEVDDEESWVLVASGSAPTPEV